MATMMMHPTLSRRISYRVLLTTTPGKLGIEWMERANTDRSIAWAMERANTDRSIAWARQSYAQMEPFFASGRYVNYLGDGRSGGHGIWSQLPAAPGNQVEVRSKQLLSHEPEFTCRLELSHDCVQSSFVSTSKWMCGIYEAACGRASGTRRSNGPFSRARGRLVAENVTDSRTR